MTVLAAWNSLCGQAGLELPEILLPGKAFLPSQNLKLLPMYQQSPILNLHLIVVDGQWTLARSLVQCILGLTFSLSSSGTSCPCLLELDSL